MNAWTDAWSADVIDWATLDARSDAVLDQIIDFRRALALAYSGGLDVEVNMTRTLDSIAHEIARQAAVRLLNGPVDVGTQFGGVAYAINLASPTQALVNSFKLSLVAKDVKLSDRPSKYLKAAFVDAREATRAAKERQWINPTGNDPTEWAVKLMEAADDWGRLSAAWQAGSDAGTVATATAVLGARIAAAKASIVVVKVPGARRAAERAVDALAISVADRIDDLARDSVAVRARIGDMARQLRDGVTISVATMPLSKYWQGEKKAVLSLLAADERKELDNEWMTGSLAESLDKWLDLRKRWPNLNAGEAAKFHSYCWAISNALTRYKVAANQLTNTEAREALLDAIDALARQVYAQLVTLRP